MMKKQFTKGKDYVIIIERNYGGVPKRLKGLVSKTGRSCKRRRGSNPLSSAIFILGLVIKFFYLQSGGVRPPLMILWMFM